MFRFLGDEGEELGLYTKLGKQASRESGAMLVCIICPYPGREDLWVQAGEFSSTSTTTVVEQLVEE